MDISLLSSIFSQQSDDLSACNYAPYKVYNPLVYAREPFERYLQQSKGASIETIYFGMNPGPWGMAQTGVPFGEIESVTQWMGISGKIDMPEAPIEKRPILGYAATRREVSGMRLWNLFKELYGEAPRFFRKSTVLNYCPLLFFDESTKNITPATLPKQIRSAVELICDNTLSKIIRLLDPKNCVAIGRYVEKRLLSILGLEKKPKEYSDTNEPSIFHIPHPSPANPQANRDWSSQCKIILADILPQQSL